MCFGSGSPLTRVSDAGSLALRSHRKRHRSDALRFGSMSVAQVLGDEFIALSELGVTLGSLICGFTLLHSPFEHFFSRGP